MRRFRPDWRVALGGSLLLVLELVLAGTYVTVQDVQITNPPFLVYPFLWIDVGLLAVLTTAPTPDSARHRLVGIGVAAGYFLVLGYFGGLFGVGNGTVPLHVDWTLPPGYGPAVLYDGTILRFVLQPYKVIGYFALAYLVYRTVLDAAGVAITGVVGLFSCVSCMWPVLGTVATSLFGSGSVIAAFALEKPYGASTLVFLSAVALLYYRPRF